MEQWKDIVGYESYYQISNYGNLRSKDRLVISKNNSLALKKGRLKKPSMANNYFLAMLSKEHIPKAITIHRLVAMHFIENPMNKKEINHKDGNKQNNHVDNLEWVTRSENSQHSYNNGLQISRKGSMHHFAKINESDVLNMFMLYNNGVSRKEIANRYTHISYSSICRILKGRTWKHFGLIEQGLALPIKPQDNEQ